MIFKLNEKYEQQFIVSEDIYDEFIHVFNDKNPLHTNEQFAIEKGFKGKVMHGNILNGFLSFFIGECLPIKNVIIHSQEIQFKNAVYLHDKLFLEAIIVGIFESVNTIEIKFNFKNSSLQTVAKGRIQIGTI